jgi:hypothetical protein
VRIQQDVSNILYPSGNTSFNKTWTAPTAAQADVVVDSYVQSWFANIPYVPLDRAADVVTRKLEQSDVVMNPPDASGWRKPSAYSASGCEGCVVRFPEDLVQWARVPTTKVKGGWRAQAHGTHTRGPCGVTMALPKAQPSTNTENSLLASALSQVKDSSFDVVVALLEARESFSSLLGLIQKLKSIVEAIIARDIRPLQRAFGFKTKNVDPNTGRYTKTVGALWLEAMYGVRPLIQDIWGLCDAIQKGIKDQDFLIVARSKRETQGNSVAQPLLVNARIFEQTASYTTSQKVSLWYKLKGSELNLAASLGLTNPAVWIWEKTTLSFVVDWLIPIGDVLSAMDSDLGFDFLGGSHTFYAQEVGIYSVKPFQFSTGMVTPPSSILHEVQAVATPTLKSFVMYRKVYTSSPKPSLFIKDPFSVSHIVTTVALIAGFRKTDLKKLR